MNLKILLITTLILSVYKVNCDSRTGDFDLNCNCAQGNQNNALKDTYCAIWKCQQIQTSTSLSKGGIDAYGSASDANCVEGNQEVTKYDISSDSFQQVKIKHLQPYDIIQSLDQQGFLINDTFIDFLHFNQNSTTHYMQIIFDDKSDIKITNDHLVSDCSKYVINYKLARDLQVGDKLCRYNTKYDALFLKNVVAIKNITMDNAYAPLTASGKFLINNQVLISSFVSFNHNYSYYAFFPYVQYKLLFKNFLSQTSYSTPSYYNSYAKFLINFNSYLIPSYIQDYLLL